MLSRDERIRNLADPETASQEGTVDLNDLSVWKAAWEEASRSSENRFDKIENRESAIASIRNAATELGRDARIEVKAIADDAELPELSADARFNYSRPGDGTYEEYRVRMEKGDQVLVFVLLDCRTVIAYGLVELGSTALGHEVKIIDVETASRRSSGLKVTIHLEGEAFEIGAAHLLLAAIIDHFDCRLYADANDRSRYVLKSLGFSRYSDSNPCLLEIRPS